ncbi:hypothetical protein [Sphingomonas sp. Ant H11]|uniref:hypothetical protein n=1 Tax=Sphingomonas sp. Ant H11 TaxID=1564113 RepID=UPI001E32104C|nr:hypothetical protein [Sphingomonas sp. Ant H11]
MAEVGAAPLAIPPVPGKARVRVWDPLVRIFHWTVAGGVIANLTFLRHEEAPHIYVGYAVLAALAIRLGWGFVRADMPASPASCRGRDGCSAISEP